MTAQQAWLSFIIGFIIAAVVVSVQYSGIGNCCDLGFKP